MIASQIKFLLLCFCIIFFGCPLFANVGEINSPKIRLIKKLDYSNTEIIALREEIKNNLVNIKKGEYRQPEYRKYTITKNDTFFSIMAKTLMDHDTLSSVNCLASLWDLAPGTEWLIPNMRGVAVFGNAADLAEKYHVPISWVSPVPGKESLYFIAGKSFEASERGFLNATVFIKPVQGFVSSRYGLRRDPLQQDPFLKTRQFHKGIDIACPIGTSVVSAAAGKVIFAGVMEGYGNLIILEHQHGYRTLYGHLKSFSVKIGNVVRAGDIIAISGATGKVTGPHLHFEVRRKGQPMNPRFKEITLHGA